MQIIYYSHLRLLLINAIYNVYCFVTLPCYFITEHLRILDDVALLQLCKQAILAEASPCDTIRSFEL